MASPYMWLHDVQARKRNPRLGFFYPPNSTLELSSVKIHLGRNGVSKGRMCLSVIAHYQTERTNKEKWEILTPRSGRPNTLIPPECPQMYFLVGRNFHYSFTKILESSWVNWRWPQQISVCLSALTSQLSFTSWHQLHWPLGQARRFITSLLPTPECCAKSCSLPFSFVEITWHRWPVSC